MGDFYGFNSGEGMNTNRTILILLCIYVTPASASDFSDPWALYRHSVYGEKVDNYLLAVSKKMQPSLNCPTKKFQFTLIRDQALQHNNTKLTSDGNGHIFISTGLFLDLQNESDLAGFLALIMAFSSDCIGPIQNSRMAREGLQTATKNLPKGLLWDLPVYLFKTAYELVEFPLALATFDIETLTDIDRRSGRREHERELDKKRKVAREYLYSNYFAKGRLVQQLEKSGYDLGTFVLFVKQMGAKKIKGNLNGAWVDELFWKSFYDIIAGNSADHATLKAESSEFNRIKSYVEVIVSELSEKANEIKNLQNSYDKENDPRTLVSKAEAEKVWEQAIEQQKIVIQYASGSQSLNREIIKLWNFYDLSNKDSGSLKIKTLDENAETTDALFWSLAVCVKNWPFAHFKD